MKRAAHMIPLFAFDDKRMLSAYNPHFVFANIRAKELCDVLPSVFLYELHKAPPGFADRLRALLPLSMRSKM